MKIIETKLAPGGDFIAITLFGVVFTRNRKLFDSSTINHERIHCRQQAECLYIPFFIIYGAEWLWHRLRGKSSFAAYMSISYEREAYRHQSDNTYINNRKLFGMWRKTTYK